MATFVLSVFGSQDVGFYYLNLNRAPRQSNNAILSGRRRKMLGAEALTVGYVIDIELAEIVARETGACESII